MLFFVLTTCGSIDKILWDNAVLNILHASPPKYLRSFMWARGSWWEESGNAETTDMLAFSITFSCATSSFQPGSLIA
ncbi:MAG: hypothetical protein QXY55_06800 [Candidatus Korarchaeota archaeon]|nr:hypothetical protein [Thermoproteota archaeon]